MTQTEARRAWLDEGVPAGVFDSEQTERIWDACCASRPDDPFSEWEKRKENQRG